MRNRGARWAAICLTAAATRACYSSEAPPLEAQADGKEDASLPVVPAVDACVPRKPWEGPGVTALVPVGPTTAMVVSGDRYFVADFNTNADAGDPSLGSIAEWHETGNLRDLWFDAPRAVGASLWDDPGLTAAFTDKATGAQILLSRFRRWTRTGTAWGPTGSIVDDWSIADAGPSPLDGAVPWAGVGVTAAFFVPGGGSFMAVSQDKAWLRHTADPDPKNWAWSDAGGFFLSQRVPWSTAPLVVGQHLYDGKGVTAAYYVGENLFTISGDKMWVFGLGEWIASGFLKDMPGWSTAPVAACGAAP